MENSKEVLQEIFAALSRHYGNMERANEAYDVVVCAIKKYGTTVSQLSFGMAEELNCEKMVWQIITDLRYARFQHLEGKEGAAGIYAYYLLIIAGIMRETGNYTERIETSAIGYEDYEALCRKMGLRL